MMVSMADVNRKPNRIINQVVDSGETAIVLKHGKPIAEIRPLSENTGCDKAIAFLSALEPVAVSTPLEQVIQEGRGRGL
jgi:antitoxin (DNA-binding transcriptional repressor) of toxin-antitoxin stability system